MLGLAGLAAFALAAALAVGQEGRFGDFETHGDVGAPKLAGTATWNDGSQEYVLTAGGVNLWAKRDEFHYAWRRLSGDFILQARVELVGQGTDPHRKAGLLVRRTLDDDSPYADAVTHGDGLTSLQYRKAKGEITEQVVSEVKGADFLQLERRGNSFTMSVARFGELLSVSQLPELALGDDVYVGLFLCSHNVDVVEKAIFRDVRVIRPVRPGFTPYRDYIGSVLEILDVETGHRQVVRRSAEPFEAPNWTTDGSALLYNTSGRGDGRGRIHRFDLATRLSTPIDTGFAIRNNNDHVLSFDGKMLGISDQSQDEGRSTVYVLPVGGGTPKKITPLTPSYLHGWAPDAKRLVYTGGRNGEFDIYARASDGSGEETNLTNWKGLDDGPEYTPDGRYIYFNSVRNGPMQIFRMKPDGSDAETVTNDDLNNWFAHFSPDGKRFAFVSYGRDVAPAEHPYYMQVYIRLRATERGPARVIAYVYGGQGTMNVPSWSPDGKQLAFVSNNDLN
jgi:regulation of enolase protein 1 (concanavalin A-like superfamily)